MVSPDEMSFFFIPCAYTALQVDTVVQLLPLKLGFFQVQCVSKITYRRGFVRPTFAIVCTRLPWVCPGEGLSSWCPVARSQPFGVNENYLWHEVPQYSTTCMYFYSKRVDRVMIIYLHVYVDGVDARNTIMDSDSSAMKGRQVSGLLGLLGVLRIEKLHQAPVLDDSLGHSNLTIGRRLHHGKQLSKGRQISEIGRQVVDIKGLGMKAVVRDMGGIEPIAVQFVNIIKAVIVSGAPRHRPPIQ